MRSLTIILLLFSLSVQADEMGEDLFKNLSYPELEVAPRASERLKTEARLARQNRWTQHLPIQISAIATLWSGLASKGRMAKSSQRGDGSYPEDAKESNAFASQLATGVGLGWLATTAVLSWKYTPYLDGYAKIRKMPNQTKRDQLSRERMAEEYLYKPSSLSDKLVYTSFLTNAAASLYVAGNTEYNPRILAYTSFVLAFTPFVFDYRWDEVKKKHEEYKKKIYGPVSALIPHSRGASPGVAFYLSF